MCKSWQQYPAEGISAVLLSSDFTLMGKIDFPVSVDLFSQYAADSVQTVLILGDFAIIRKKNFPVSVNFLSYHWAKRQ